MRLLAALLIPAALGSQPPATRFPPGVTEVARELTLEDNADVSGTPTTVLRPAPGFTGRALLIVRGHNVRIHDLAIDGNRAALETRAALPPSEVPFSRFTRANGILAEDVTNLTIENVRFREIAGFAILVARGRGVTIDRVSVSRAGSRNPEGRNNSTGGILLEEGTANFRVTRSDLQNVRGNGIWTHSLYHSPRNGPGEIAFNTITETARDAIQVGHASGVRVENNRGSRIGYPVEEIDQEARAVPVALDTAGNVDGSVYANNRFEEIDGKCIDLDGFHDGEIRQNVCINRGSAPAYPWGGYGIVMNNSNPDMQSRNITIEGNTIEGAKFGGVFVIGSGHRIAGNRLLNLNLAHCNEDAAKYGCYYAPGEPEMLEAGIYLGRGADRPSPARDNVIENNEIAGFRMDRRCILRAPGIAQAWNKVANNVCRP